MSTVLEVLFSVLFAIWIILTIAFQFTPMQVRMRSLDPLYMLPSWSFFAPVPNSSDYVFFLRYENHHETSSWREPGLPAPPSLGFLWDPARRQRKVVIDISQSLGEFARSGQHDVLHYTTAYLLLLQYASNKSEAFLARGVQVAIGTRPADGEEFILFFQSHMHELESRAPESPLKVS